MDIPWSTNNRFCIRVFLFVWSPLYLSFSSHLKPTQHGFGSISLEVCFPNFFLRTNSWFLALLNFFSPAAGVILQKSLQQLMKKWNILGVVVFQTELHKDIPVLEHYSSLNFLASLPMKRPATWVVLVGVVLMDFQHCKSHCTLHLCVGAIGSQNGHLWTGACLGSEMTKEVWCDATLLFETFHFRKIFNPVCAFTTGAQPPGHSPDTETFWSNCVALDWFYNFLGTKLLSALAITVTSGSCPGKNLSVWGPRRKALGLLLLFHAQLLHY